MTEYRPATETETDEWLNGWAMHPGAIETEHGLMIPVYVNPIDSLPRPLRPLVWLAVLIGLVLMFGGFRLV